MLMSNKCKSSGKKQRFIEAEQNKVHQLCKQCVALIFNFDNSNFTLYDSSSDSSAAYTMKFLLMYLVIVSIATAPLE